MFPILVGVSVVVMAYTVVVPRINPQSRQGQAIQAKDVEAVQDKFIAARDILLKSAEGFGNYETFIASYKEQYGVEPPASIIADLEVGRKRRLLEDAAEYSHLLGLNAFMSKDFVSAMAFFEEAVKYDPNNGSYKEALTEAQKRARQKK